MPVSRTSPRKSAIARTAAPRGGAKISADAGRVKRAAGVRAAPTGSRRSRQIEDKRSTILGAALWLFSRYGLHGTSVDQVAARADVSKSNLLYYFSSKEELYVSVLRDLLDVWLEPLRGFSVDQDPREAIGNYIRRKLVLSRDQPDASRLFCLEMVQGAPLLQDSLSGELRELVERKSDVIRAWMADGRLSPTEPYHLMFTLWAVTQHYADFAVQVKSVTGRSLDEEDFFEQTVSSIQSIVLDGVAHRAPRPPTRKKLPAP